MLDKPDATHTLGLETEGNLLKGAQLSLFKGKPKLERVFEISLMSPAENVNPLYIAEIGKPLSDLVKNNLTVTTLPANEVLVRQLEVKLKKEKDVDAVLLFQAEPLLPYPIENAVVDRIKLAQTNEGTLLTILAARKDHLAQHIEQWRAWQIEPEVSSCVPAALAAFSKTFISSENPYFVLDLGTTHTTCILIKEGKLLAAQSVHNGITNLQDAFNKDCKEESGSEELFLQHDFASLNPIDTPHLIQACESLRLDITRLLYSLTKQTKGQEVAEIVFTGSGIALKNISAFFSQALGKTSLLSNADPNFPLSGLQLQKFAIPIGAALTALPKNPGQVNFRQKEFSYPNPWKRFKKPLAIYFGLCLFLAAAFYFFGQAYIGYHEDRLKENYVQLLALMNKPYRAFEEEFKAKFPHSASFHEGEVPSLKKLTSEELLSRLNYLDKELQEAPDIFPLFPNVPRASDVLAWLSVLPSLHTKEETASNSQPIQIDSFSYTMVKRPEQSKRQEKYQVKVELEFTSPTPKQAREFHDILIAPNDFVDPKGEVKWSSNRGKYRTSFFLKDKTVYPSAS